MAGRSALDAYASPDVLWMSCYAICVSEPPVRPHSLCRQLLLSVSHSRLCVDSGNIYTIHSAVSVTVREGQHNLHSNDAELKGLYCRWEGVAEGVKVSEASTKSVDAV